jgi:hypothetical protein
MDIFCFIYMAMAIANLSEIWDIIRGLCIVRRGLPVLPGGGRCYDHKDEDKRDEVKATAILPSSFTYFNLTLSEQSCMGTCACVCPLRHWVRLFWRHGQIPRHWSSRQAASSRFSSSPQAWRMSIIKWYSKVRFVHIDFCQRQASGNIMIFEGGTLLTSSAFSKVQSCVWQVEVSMCRRFTWFTKCRAVVHEGVSNFLWFCSTRRGLWSAGCWFLGMLSVGQFTSVVLFDTSVM